MSLAGIPVSHSVDAPPPAHTLPHEGFWIALVLLLALLRGMLYSQAIPLWLLPDEPAHFEYVETIRHTGRLPQGDVPDPVVRRAIIATLAQSDFSRFFPGWLTPEVLAAPLPPLPGISELDHPPLFYLLGALVIAPLPDGALALHGWVLRLLGVGLSLITIGCAALAARDLFPNEPWLRLMVPATIVLNPAHTSITASINNDHLAEVWASLFFVLAGRIWRDGWSRGRVALLVALLVGGLLTKRTTILLVILAGWLALLTLRSQRLPWFAGWRRGLVVGGCLLLVGGLAIRGDAATGWYDPHNALWPQRVGAAHRGAAFLEVLPAGDEAGIARQFVPLRASTPLTVTLTGWADVGSNAAGQVALLRDGAVVGAATLAPTPGWRPFSLSVGVPPSPGLEVQLRATGPGAVRFDELALQAGEAALPLRNPGMEGRGLDLRQPLMRLLNGPLQLRLDPDGLNRLFNPGLMGAEPDFFHKTLSQLLRYFWLGFGAERIALAAPWQWLLWLPVMALLLGVPVALTRGTLAAGPALQPWQRRALAFGAGAVLLTLAVTLARAAFAGLYLPHPRYLYVAVVPLSLLLAAGLRGWLPARLGWLALLVWLLLLMALDLVALFLYVLPEYYG